MSTLEGNYGPKGSRTLALFQTLEAAGEKFASFLQHSPLQVVLPKECPDLGALRELLARSLVLLLRFL